MLASQKGSVDKLLRIILKFVNFVNLVETNS